MTLSRLGFIAVLVGLCLFDPAAALAKTVRYELVIKNEPVNLSGKKTVDFALTVNGGIPAPTLEFTEGDDAEILVENQLAGEEVSIHWHGLLLPPDQDGVPYVNTPPILAGTSLLFKFRLRQNGTYWYHSHTMLQEQKGVFGALIVHPKKKAIRYDRDAVVVINDWSDENPDHIIRNLRKDGDYYLYKKDSVRSYLGALSEGGSAFKTQLANEWSRMGGMDLSDVGYDAFLINGQRTSQLTDARPGERVRVRIINASASSYFYVGMGTTLTVISADGVDVKPVLARSVLMGMAETYDVLVTMPASPQSLELRATAQDGTGFASTWIGKGAPLRAPDVAKPGLYVAMDHSNMAGMDHSKMATMDHSKMNHDEMDGPMDMDMAMPMPMSHVKSGGDPVDWSSQSDAMLQQNATPRSAPDADVVNLLTVDRLTSLKPTTLPKDAPVHELKLVLNGDMNRYIWYINGKSVTQDRLIEIRKGEVVRFKFVNESMMHHPMHLHGHFFRVVNSAGDYSPLKHTVDVEPMGSREIEFFANEPGQWMLHCHNLYHMETGMARVVRYSDFNLDANMQMHDKHDPHTHEHLYTYGQLEAASNHARANFKLMRTWDELDLKFETAQIQGKNFAFDTSDHWESEGDASYRRWFSNWANAFGGATLYNEKVFGQLGFSYILPFMFETALSVNHEGHFRFDIERRFQWTKSVFTDTEFTWRPSWGGERDTEFEVSLMYGPEWTWAVGLMATEKKVGIGAQVQF